MTRRGTGKGALALVIATPLAVALGFFLPDLACRARDASGDEELGFETRQARLDVAAAKDAGNALRALAGNALTIELGQADEGGGQRALDAAREALAFFHERGFDALDPARFAANSTKLQLAVDAEGGRAARLWEIDLTGKDPSDWAVMLVDDASGKAVQLFGNLAVEDGAATPDAEACAAAWADHLDMAGALRSVAPEEGRRSSAAYEDMALAVSDASDTAYFALDDAGVNLNVFCEVLNGSVSFLLDPEPAQGR